MLSWHWCTVAAGEIRIHDLTIARPALPQGHCFFPSLELRSPTKELMESAGMKAAFSYSALL